jgi:hypothetical protein
MSEEVQNLAEVEAVPEQVEQVVDANPATENDANETKTDEAKRTFSQEELDAAISKRLAKENRKWEREQSQRLAEMQSRLITPKADPETGQFESPEAYAEALAVHKAEELIAARDRHKRESEALYEYQEREEAAREKYNDFEQVAYNPNLRVTTVMAEAIRDSDVGADVAYWLGSNPKEAERISRLSDIAQAREIGKIENKLSIDPVVKKTTSAPSPISPVTSRSSGNQSYDTTDPRSIKTMSTSEWIEADRRRQIKKAEARNR